MSVDPASLDFFSDAIRRVGGRLTEIAGARGAAHTALSKQELVAIGTIGLHGAMRMGEIADRLGVRQSAVTPLVDRLEDHGLVRRHRSEEDRRVWLAELTEAGTRVYADEDAVYRQAAAEMLAPLSPEEQRALVQLFKKMRVPD
ncbi:MAG: MarR family transcriptional regulator [Bacteroidota bacterium]